MFVITEIIPKFSQESVAPTKYTPQTVLLKLVIASCIQVLGLNYKPEGSYLIHVLW